MALTGTRKKTTAMSEQEDHQRENLDPSEDKENVPTIPPSDLSLVEVESGLAKVAKLQSLSSRDRKSKRMTRPSDDRKKSTPANKRSRIWQGFEGQTEAQEVNKSVNSEAEERKARINRTKRDLIEHIQPKFLTKWNTFKAVDIQTRRLAVHFVTFNLKEAPFSAQGRRCRLFDCGQIMRGGEIIIAVTPGRHWSGYPENYHLACFEELIDPNSLYFLTRFEIDPQGSLNGGLIVLFQWWLLDLIRNVRNSVDRLPSERSTSVAKVTDAELHANLDHGRDLRDGITIANIVHLTTEGTLIKCLEGYTTKCLDLLFKSNQLLDISSLAHGELVAKAVDDDLNWRILDLLPKRLSNKSEPNKSVQGATSKQEEGPNSAQTHFERHRLSNGLRAWEEIRSIVMFDEELWMSFEARIMTQYSSGDLRRMKHFARHFRGSEDKFKFETPAGEYEEVDEDGVNSADE